MLASIKKLEPQKYYEIANIQKENFIQYGDMEKTSTLIECDLNFQNTATVADRGGSCKIQRT